ncbi:hypothetical protein QO002_006116 [Pararhizobium capsulatum DSM 1112]|uniref:Uncharacterized protein n=1 Tax=Pararhizobium capsulatum DSM 1112 TaxID=1121113 RepID=A0ABU0C064_9HYPH|nr:hypothetical protein [Pararhizobium capsulatum DSM 1112]
MDRGDSCGVPLRPGDVAMLRGLVKEYCENRQCRRQGVEGEDVARQLVRWFQSGMTEKERLRYLLLSAPGRQT